MSDKSCFLGQRTHLVCSRIYFIGHITYSVDNPVDCVCHVACSMADETSSILYGDRLLHYGRDHLNNNARSMADMGCLM